jgi:hypothetical protein
MLSTISASVGARPVESDRAEMLGWYPSSLAMERIRVRTASLTLGLPESA